jgi:2'-5' RNA ligase
MVYWGAMKKLTFVLAAALIWMPISNAQNIYLSREVYKKVPFSSQFSEDGAIIRNVDYRSVNALVAQLNEIYNIELKDRGEAHITVITPPEFKSSISKVFSIDELLNRYRGSLQDTSFDVVCVGSRRSQDEQKVVFYLVVKSPELFELRKNLANEGNARSALPLSFDPKAFWPHITIGYINGDVFEFTKGVESCVPGLNLVLY